MARAPSRVPAAGRSAAWGDPLSETHSRRGMKLILLATYPFASEYSKGEKLVGSEVSPDFSMTNVMGDGSLSLSCAAHIPCIDGLFVAALLASALLNWATTLLSIVALARADASLVSPLLTFNPAFTLLLAWPTLHEVPGLRQSTGVAVMLLGAYLLDVEEARTELLACSSKVCSRWALILRMPR